MSYNLGPGPLTPEFEQVKADIGIVENGNTATHAILNGQYVIWKGNLYVARTDISSGTALSAESNGNLTAKTQGIGAEVAALNSKIAKFSLSSYTTVASYDDLKTLLTNTISTMSNFEVRNIMFSCTSAFETFGTALWTAVLTRNADTYFSALCYPVNKTGIIKVVRNQGGTWYIEDYALNSKITLKESHVVTNFFRLYRSACSVFGACLGGTGYSCDSANGVVKYNGTAITVPSGYRPLYGVDVRDTLNNRRIFISIDGTISAAEAFTASAIRFSTAWMTNDTYPT